MITILYVDDEPVLLDLCSLYLQRSGEFSVTTTTDPIEAIDIIKEGNFGTIITDYEMPVMNGIELLKKIKEDNPDIPVIIFTGRGREEVVIEALNNGADFYLQKGGDPKAQFTELIHKIKQSIRRRAAETEIRQKNLELQASYEQISATQEEFKLQLEEIEQQAKLLKEDEEKFRTVADFTYNWEYWLSPDGSFTYVSPSCVRISGYTAEEFTTNPDLFSRIIHRADREKITSIFSILSSPTINPESTEYRITNKSGEERWISHECLRVYKNDGVFLGIRGSCRDITIRKRYERDLLRTKREWEHIFRAIGSPTVILDRNHRIIHANDAVLTLTGKTIEELRTKFCLFANLGG